MAKEKTKWIAGAINHPGALTAAAKRSGQSISEYCNRADLSSTDKKRCVLKETLAGFKK